MRSSEDAPMRSSIPPCFTRRDSLLTALPASCCLRSFSYRWVPICATCLVAAFWFHSHAAKLGTQLADLHLDNKRLGETLQKEAGIVGTAVGPRGHPPTRQRKTSGQYGCVGRAVLLLWVGRPVLPQERNVNPRLHIWCAVNSEYD